MENFSREEIKDVIKIILESNDGNSPATDNIGFPSEKTLYILADFSKALQDGKGREFLNWYHTRLTDDHKNLKAKNQLEVQDKFTIEELEKFEEFLISSLKMDDPTIDFYSLTKSHINFLFPQASYIKKRALYDFAGKIRVGEGEIFKLMYLN